MCGGEMTCFPFITSFRRQYTQIYIPYRKSLDHHRNRAYLCEIRSLLCSNMNKWVHKHLNPHI